jgi:hypothetical protein
MDGPGVNQDRRADRGRVERRSAPIFPWPAQGNSRIGRAQWFCQGETPGYRTLYVWFEKENLMIALQTNSQPAGDTDKLDVLMERIHQIVQSQAR